MVLKRQLTTSKMITARQLLPWLPYIASATLHSTVIWWQGPGHGPIVMDAHHSPASTPVQVRVRVRPPEPLAPKIIEEPTPVQVLEEFPLITEEVVDEIPLIEDDYPLEYQSDHIEDAPTTFAPTPEYPRVARLRGFEGFVRLKIGVNGRGVPIHIELMESSGFDILDQAAIRGLERWRFEPSNGREDLSFWTEKVIEFQLR